MAYGKPLEKIKVKSPTVEQTIAEEPKEKRVKKPEVESK